MKKIIMTAVVATLSMSAFAQKYMTRSGKVSFFSATSIENIEAFNNESAAALDSKTGDVLFQLPIKSFKFDKQLMQDHFNEDYMESDKFPKASFKGKINPADISEKDGTYKTTVKGQLTIHGESKEVTVPGTITIKGGQLTVDAKFKVKPTDYKIKIPSVAASKIAQQIEITINTVMKKI
jgi:polyisoprenoid-binding protein YceI